MIARRDDVLGILALLFACAAVVCVSDALAVLVTRQVYGWFPYESIVLVTLYAYFLAGLLYRQALVCGVLATAAYFAGRGTVQPGMYSAQYEAYYLLMANTIGWIGLYVASAVFVAFFMRWLGKYGWWKIAAVAIGNSVVFFLIFEVWFKIPLPKGPLETLLHIA